MLLTRLYWVSNMSVIPCMHHIGQKLKRLLERNRLDLHHDFVESKLFYKSPKKIDLLSVDELPRSVKLYDFSVPMIFEGIKTKMATLAAGKLFL